MAQQRSGRRRRLLAVLGTLAVAGGLLVLGVGTGFSAQAATTVKPAPEDCIAYDPNNLSIVDIGGGQFRLQDGPLFMQVFANATDAQNGLSVAKGFNRQCFVGRDSGTHLMEYWKGGRNKAGPVSDEDCIAYDRSKLKVVRNTRFHLWQVTDGTLALEAFDKQSQALRALKVAKAHRQQCFIGRNGGSELMEYWR